MTIDISNSMVIARVLYGASDSRIYKSFNGVDSNMELCSQ